MFRRALDSELDKIVDFYVRKEAELLNEVKELAKDAHEFATARSPEFALSDAQVMMGDRAGAGAGNGGGGGSGLRRWRSHESHDGEHDHDHDDDGSDSEDDDEGEETSEAGQRLLRQQRGSRRGSRSGNLHASMLSDAPSEMSFRRRMSQVFGEDERESALNMLYDKQVTLKKRAISLFVALRELKSFVQLNRTGFSKALKKYDKILQHTLRADYLDKRVLPTRCFKKDTGRELDDLIVEIEQLYAGLVTGGDLAAAKKELRLHLREHVVWERNTVWREMIGIERKAHAANMGFKGTLLGDDQAKKQLAGDEEKPSAMREMRTPLGRIAIPRWLFGARMFTLLALLAIFFILLFVPTFATPEQSNCFAMLVFVSLLWATEVSQRCYRVKLCADRSRSYHCL